jgi:regulator of replication initiation timing
MEELQKENEELKKQNEDLRKRLRESYQTIAQLKNSLNRQYRYNQDYVPYPDEDDRR